MTDSATTPTPMTITDIYRSTVHDDRRRDYPSFSDEAEALSAIQGILSTIASPEPRHVFLDRLLMKIVREWHKPKLDNLVDIVGYTECQFAAFPDLYPQDAPAAPTPPKKRRHHVEDLHDIYNEFSGSLKPLPVPFFFIPDARSLDRSELVLVHEPNTFTIKGKHYSPDELEAFMRVNCLAVNTDAYRRHFEVLHTYRKWLDRSLDTPNAINVQIFGRGFELVHGGDTKTDPRIDCLVQPVEAMILWGAHVIYDITKIYDPVESTIYRTLRILACEGHHNVNGFHLVRVHPPKDEPFFNIDHGDIHYTRADFITELRRLLSKTTPPQPTNINPVEHEIYRVLCELEQKGESTVRCQLSGKTRSKEVVALRIRNDDEVLYTLSSNGSILSRDAFCHELRHLLTT